MFNIVVFGPGTEAEVRIDLSGSVQDIRIFHPNKRNDIVIPAEWAADVTGSITEIISQVSESLSGGRVRAVRLVPMDPDLTES